MGLFTRRLTLKDYALFIGALVFGAVVVCLLLTMNKSAHLESQVKELRSLNYTELIEQDAVLDYPGESTNAFGKITFARSYDSVPFLTFSVEGGPGFVPGFHELNEEMKDFWRKEAAEQSQRFQKSFVAKDVTPYGFEWASDPRRVGGSVSFSREYRVHWNASGLKLVPLKALQPSGR